VLPGFADTPSQVGVEPDRTGAVNVELVVVKEDDLPRIEPEVPGNPAEDGGVGLHQAQLERQDEGYWGRNLFDRGITCWMPFHDVDVDNGCMHFVDGGHTDGVLVHRRPDGVASDLLLCEPDTSRAVARPVRLGGVTFHHSKTPHMTTPNRTDRWRKILTQHFRQAGTEGEGDHYPWKVYVNQFTGQTIVPPRS
jgi:hypothetical protein